MVAMHPVEVLRHMASDLTARAQLASIAGKTYKGKRDLYEVLGYARVLQPVDYRERYRRGDLSARIVEAFPKATWRGGAELIEDEDPEITTAFEEAWDDLNKRLSIWAVLQRADILAGLGWFSIILLGAPGPLDQPLEKLSADNLLFLAPYGTEEVTIDTLEEKTDDPRFGLPLFYTIKRAGINKATINKRVHWTRVIHLADNILDDRVYGSPTLERVWNRLDDLDKVVGGGSEAFWARVHQGIITKFDPNVKVDKTTIDNVKEQVDEFIHGLRRMLTLRGVDVDALGSDVSNFSPQVTSVISIISGATGIPQRILLGSERGELASTQDKTNWDERVSDRRRDFAEPVVRQMVDRFIDLGVLPEPDQYEVRWPDIEDLDDTQKAEVANSWSKLNSQAGGTVVTPEEIRDRVLGLPKLEEEAPPPEEKVVVEQPAPVPPTQPQAPPASPGATES